jgi:putative transposase
MARPLRYVLPDVAVHIIQRGVNRVACFRVDADYLVYLSYLRQLSEKHDCAVHAYCLMTNHVHLLLTPTAADSCTRLMRDLGRRYVPYFNHRHERTGTLWEGRFRSCIAESARYVLACYRYIELNPVRAEMVEHPRDYPWSSYAANSGAFTDGLVSQHPEFAALATDPDETARRVYGPIRGADGPRAAGSHSRRGEQRLPARERGVQEPRDHAVGMEDRSRQARAAEQFGP